MFRELTAICAVGAVLTGCGMSQQAQYQSAQMAEGMALNDDLIACRDKYPKLTKGQAAAAIRCANSAYDRHPTAHIGNRDLMQLATVRSLSAAEDYDAGKISASEYERRIMTIDAEFKVATHNRMSQDMAVAAAQQQAAASQQQAAMQSIAAGAALLTPPPPPPPAPPAAPRMPVSTRCASYGNVTNCSSY